MKVLKKVLNFKKELQVEIKKYIISKENLKKLKLKTRKINSSYLT